MLADRKRALLAALPGLGLALDDRLTELAAGCSERSWRAGEQLVLAPATASGGCVVLVTGRLGLFPRRAGARRHVTAGEFVALGADAVLAEAETDTLALVLDVGLVDVWSETFGLSSPR